MSERRPGPGGPVGLWLRLASALVPATKRESWLREWYAEVAAERRRGGRPWRLAAGAPRDAWALGRAARSGQRRGLAGSHGRGGLSMQGTGTELRRAARSLLRAPGFTSASVVTLGAGLGATAAIFTLVDAILLRPLPYPEADRLVRVEHTIGDDATNTLARFTFGFFEEESRSFELFGGHWAPELYTLAGQQSAERVTGVQATPELLRVLGASPLAGRLFDETDAMAESGIVLSERLWRRLYGSDPGLVGRTVLVEGEPREVLGIVSSGAELPGREIDVWVPWAVPEGVRVDDAFRLNVVARLAPDVTVQAAQADLDRLTARLPEFASFYSTYLDQLGLRTRVRPLRDEVVGDLERALWILLGAVAIVLLVAGANVAMLFLVRAEGRRPEVAVRAALGAGRSKLVMAFLSESVMVAVAAGALGLLLAFGAVGLLVSFAPPGIPRLDEIQVRGATLGVVLALVFASALALAFYPVLRFSGTRPAGSRGAASADRGTARMGSALVIVQVALALVLLTGASLLVQTFRHLRAVDPGFDAAGVLVAEVSLPSATYPAPAQVLAFQSQLLERVEALPGVRRAAFGPSPLRIAGCNGLYVEGMVLREGEFPPCVPLAFVGPGYWEVLGIPLEAGRPIGDADLRQPPAVVVTANAAERLWPGGDPTAGGVHPAPRRGPPWYPVIGVAGAVRGRGPDQPATEAIYLPIASTGDEGQVLRTTGLLVATEPGGETALVPALRRIVSDLAPDVPLSVSGTLEDELARTMARSSFTLFLLATAAATALVLGLVGLYGVVAWRVETRRSEIGIRMAMGARGAQVRGMVLLHSMRLVAAGTLAGLVAAAFLTRTLSSLLFGVTPGDPLTLAVTALALASAAALASWMPAQRATRVDPARALRE